MTRTETAVYLALWIGICLVLFFGNWVVMFGMGLIVACMDWITVKRINAARMQGFEIGKKSVKPVYVSEQAGHKATFCYFNGRPFKVGRDC